MDFKVRLNLIKKANPKGRKYDRILKLQPYYQNRRIKTNEKLKSCNDTQIGQTQLFGIEPGYNSKDDWPDAWQQCVDELEKYIDYSDSSRNQILQGTMKPNHIRI